MKTIEERAKLKAKMYLSDCIDENVRTTLTDDFIAGYIQGSKEQKAIDEEVRLKKCDDMTEAEYNRETAFADWYHKNGKGTPTYSDAIEWARKDLLDKACNAFCHTGCPHKIDSYNCLNNKCDTWKIFRKIMEE